MTDPTKVPECCAVCGKPLDPQAATTVLDIPMVETKLKLCPTDALHAMRVGGAVAKFLGDLGVTPNTAKRAMDGARGLGQLIGAIRGPQK